VAFGEAVIGIIRGTYPAAPPGRQWLFGFYDGDGRPGSIAVSGPNAEGIR
jgi:hypothetical protein